MKYFPILLIALVFNSCKSDKSKTIPFNNKDKPSPYISNLSKDVNSRNDTLYFKNDKLNAVLYSINEITKDTLFIESYTNGVLNGISKKWYANSQLMELRYYSCGQKKGKQVAFFENGNKKFEFTAKDDHYEGELREWNMDGKLIHLATFENGQEEGVQKMWYDNGKIRANYVMLNGKRYGLLGTKNCKNVSDSIFVVK